MRWMKAAVASALESAACRHDMDADDAWDLSA
jgi:hypothetical protein